MAVQSAHLTSLNLSKPSIFDYIAQESLNDLLNPAFKKLIESLSLKYPVLNNIVGYLDESYLGISCALQFYYLRNYGASFSECLYGLRRIGRSGEKRLSRREFLLSLIALSVVPYLLQKLQSKSEEAYFSNDTSHKKQKTLIQIHSTLQVAYQLARWIQHLRFISGQTKYNSPLLKLAGLRLIVEDPAEQQQSARNWLTMAIQRSFELGTFFLQCYQSWKDDGKRAYSSIQAIPPPPLKTAEDSGLSDGKCGICRGARQLDTALAVSGHVFCFICIQHYLSRHSCCPITKYPASFNDLIRLFPDSS